MLSPSLGEYFSGFIEEDLGDQLENLFASFEAEPLAAASIAQVHGATLADGLQAALQEAIAKLPIPKVMSYQLESDRELPGWSSVRRSAASSSCTIPTGEETGVEAAPRSEEAPGPRSEVPRGHTDARAHRVLFGPVHLRTRSFSSAVLAGVFKTDPELRQRFMDLSKA